MIKNMQKLLFILLMISCLVLPAYAENISDIRSRQGEDALFNIMYIQQQIQAVDNDMILYFGWMPEEKQKMKEEAQDSILKLELLRTKLLAINMPLELNDVKNEMMVLINLQKDIYRSVETKTDDQIQAAYGAFQKNVDALGEHVGQSFQKYWTAQRLPDDYSVLQDKELKLFTDSIDRELFQKAAQLLEQKKFKESYDILSSLKDKYSGAPAEDSILMRLSDCLSHYDSDLPEELRGSEVGFDLLKKILDKKTYSPVLYDVYHRWRTKYQEFEHGMSNWSEIPNMEYNDKRMEVVKVIQQYLLNHPNDDWAKVQILMLLTLENIVRGGEPFGNSNLRHMAVLYMDLDQLPQSDGNAQTAEGEESKE